MKLEQGQIWKQGENYLRIVEWARLSIEYKVMKDPVSKVGTLHKVTKKEFCRLLKGAVLLKTEDLPKPETEEAAASATTRISDDLSLMLEGSKDGAANQMQEAFERINEAAGDDDLPLLLEALNAPGGNFRFRELLAQPIAEIGGTDCLEELLAVHAAGSAGGHDSTELQESLRLLTEREPEGCRLRLTELLEDPNFKNREAAAWMLACLE